MKVVKKAKVGDIFEINEGFYYIFIERKRYILKEIVGKRKMRKLMKYLGESKEGLKELKKQQEKRRNLT